MRAYWLESRKHLTSVTLFWNEIDYRRISPSQASEMLSCFSTVQGYVQQDQVSLTPQTPNLDVLLEKFGREHKHSDDEVRYVTDGEGIFDIRSLDDRWMRVHVEAGDYIVVPGERFHRFMLTEERRITAVRLFKDERGWEAHYRDS